MHTHMCVLTRCERELAGEARRQCPGFGPKTSRCRSLGWEVLANAPRVSIIQSLASIQYRAESAGNKLARALNKHRADAAGNKPALSK